MKITYCLWLCEVINKTIISLWYTCNKIMDIIMNIYSIIYLTHLFNTFVDKL